MPEKSSTNRLERVLVFITDGSKGIGKGVAIALSETGLDIVVPRMVEPIGQNVEGVGFKRKIGLS